MCRGGVPRDEKGIGIDLAVIPLQPDDPLANDLQGDQLLDVINDGLLTARARDV